MTSPYTFSRSEGLVHIHAPADPKGCVACVRADAYEIIVHETRRQVLQEVAAAVRRSTGEVR